MVYLPPSLTLAMSIISVYKDKQTEIMHTKIELKKLQFHLPKENKKGKCHYLHVGKPNPTCPGMKVHGRQAELQQETTYLGDIIRSDGKNISNVKNRVSKGVGLVTEIMNILKNVSFGHRYFEIALILREARLINGILTNAEVWYSLGSKDISDLEQIDRMFLKQVFCAANSVSNESLYLELGVIPIGIIIKARRISYLHYLANLNHSSMLYRVFITQWKYPDKGDWTEQVKSDLKYFGLDWSLNDFASKSKNSFKRFLKKKTKEVALDYLLKLKEGHSKMSNLNYTDLKMQSYLRNSNINVSEAQNVFRFRTRSAYFKANYKSKYSDQSCPLCQLHLDTQELSFKCEKINEELEINEDYNNIFKKDVQSKLAKTLFEVTTIRNQYFAFQEGPSASADAAK